jgi:transcriptional regulator with XRE-family HTH domain
MRSIVASNVKRIIREKGYKQYAIGVRAGYRANKFNDMLNGRKIITDTDIPPICKALGVTPNELFELSEQQEY